MGRAVLEAHNGVVAIYDEDYPNAFSDPWGNLPGTQFHSSVPFSVIEQEHHFSITLPARSGTWLDVMENHQYLLFNVTGSPILDAFVNGIGAGGMIMLQSTLSGSQMGVRTCGVVQIGSGIYLLEHVTADNLPAITVDIDIYLTVTAARVPTNNVLFEVSADPHFEADYGRFNINKHYLRVDNQAPDFKVAHGRTMDTANGGIRYVTQDGSFVDSRDDNGTVIYNGSWSGPDYIGLSDG